MKRLRPALPDQTTLLLPKLLFQLLVFAVIIGFSAGIACAQKGKKGGGNGGGGNGGGGEPPAAEIDPGKIFFAKDVGNSIDFISVRSEGGGTDPDQYTFDIHFELSDWAEPSELEHRGEFWYAQREDIGGGWFELFALRENGIGKIQLTDSNDDLIVMNSAFGNNGIRWSMDDNAISFIGMRLDGSGNAIEAGIYSAVVLYDGQGNVTGLDGPPVLTISTGIYPDDPQISDIDEDVDISTFDFTSDGMTVVWTPFEGGLWVTELISGGIETNLTPDGVTPSLSPNDSTIAFDASDGSGGFIDLIEIDGSSRGTIVSLANGKKDTFLAKLPFWSPAGNQLVFTNVKQNRNGITSDINMINADGTDLTDITGFFFGLKTTVGWRLPAVDVNITHDWSGDIYQGNAWTDRGFDIKIQPDGKFLICGLVSKDQYYQHQDMMVVRYNADFSIDSTFGNNGLAIADFGPLSRDYGLVLTLQADGRILVAGVGYDYTNAPNGIAVGIAARFSADGTLDAQYQGNFADTYGYTGIVQQASGKYMLVSSAKITNGKFDVVLTRLNTDFTLDTSFGSGGSVVHDYEGGNGLANLGNSLVQHSDGKLLVVGSSTGHGYYVLFNADGTTTGVEDTIDTSALGRTGFKQAVLDSNNNAYVVGESQIGEPVVDKEIIVVKIDANGIQDQTFGVNGVFRFNESPEQDSPRVIKIDSNGNLVLSGHSDVGNYVLRATAEGVLDDTFAENGVAFLGGVAAEDIRGVVIDSSDRPLAAGERIGESGTMDTWFLRLNN